MPGAPPIKTIEPATIPPPRTRSSSSIPHETRSSSCGSMAVYAIGATACNFTAVPAMPWACPVGRKRSSTSVFHSWQSGHCPSHFRDWPPQLWQTKIVLGCFAMRKTAYNRCSRYTRTVEKWSKTGQNNHRSLKSDDQSVFQRLISVI